MNIPTLADRIAAARENLLEAEGIARLIVLPDDKRCSGHEPEELVALAMKHVMAAQEQLFWFGYLPSETQRILVPNDDERDILDRAEREGTTTI